MGTRGPCVSRGPRTHGTKHTCKPPSLLPKTSGQSLSSSSSSMEPKTYLPELIAEKDSLDPSFVHAMRLLTEEVQKLQDSDGKQDDDDDEKKYLDIISNKNIKLSERVLIPVKQYPKFNFVGKLLGPRGNSLKRLQEDTGSKMSILGKGSMRDKSQEEELRKSGEAKYSHLSDELHVLMEVFAPPGEAYSRMSHALDEIKKFLVPDYNDEIRQEQLRELSYLNGSEDTSRGQGIRARGIRTAAPLSARSRGGVIPPPPTVRGVPAPRGTTTTRGSLPAPPVTRGVPTSRARGTQAAPGYRPPPSLSHDIYDEYAYDDGYGGEYDDQSYEEYDDNYVNQTQSASEYYDYGQGSSEEDYNTYGHEEWPLTRPSLKVHTLRSARGGYREHPYGRY
ncbi:KH domain-containing, RNA-binding, signal transduction-associated protein 2 isoform X2 [Ambystoma mexicanum]|uniref:KH domain-containing, RNA-binding, signal transduction-associated protein 2 isoform X2 n=1 Tax=Ambystoma mexicanum TaxID=8296 RepID=UPI0037E854FE